MSTSKNAIHAPITQYCVYWVGATKSDYRPRVLMFDDLQKALKQFEKMKQLEVAGGKYQTRVVKNVTANFLPVHVGTIKKSMDGINLLHWRVDRQKVPDGTPLYSMEYLEPPGPIFSGLDISKVTFPKL